MPDAAVGLGLSRRRACRMSRETRATPRPRPIACVKKPRMGRQIIELAGIHGGYGRNVIIILPRREGGATIVAA